MVSFRLSQDEYERLRNLSLAGSARSVSEFARMTLCRIPAASDLETGGPRLAHLENTVAQLTDELRELRRLVELLQGAEPAQKEALAEARRQ